MDDKTIISIALKQMQINELKEMKKIIADSIDESVTFTITTRHRIRIYRNAYIQTKTYIRRLYFHNEFVVRRNN